jgi:radical SAM superfamily enzyme YgiQ (UPF0313 family)
LPWRTVNVLLLSTYELGRQPFGLASPAAWLKQAGATVLCRDLAVETLDDDDVRRANLVAFYLPMHTATRLAAVQIERVRQLNPTAHLCCFGLYAPVNEAYLRRLGVHSILGGEFEEGLLALLDRLPNTTTLPGADPQPEPIISMARQRFLVPDRSGLPDLTRYAQLELGDGRRRVVGYTEATRGCKHLCRHCPIVPVYGGRFRVVQRDVVLEDIRRQVEHGAQHITFGDPDFFNGPAHAVAIVAQLHQEFPDLSYDATIKIEHLRNHEDRLPTLRDTGCLFITSAVEAIDERTLVALDKRHTRDDFVHVVGTLHRIGLNFNPTFVTFSPWTTLRSYTELLTTLDDLDLIDSVSPIQYAIRLLIPAGSRLLELVEVRELVKPYDEAALTWPWEHPDPNVDELYEAVLATVQEGTAGSMARREIFGAVYELAYHFLGRARREKLCSRPHERPPRTPVPYLTEPWYC